MKVQKKFLDHFAIAFLSFFYIGYAPKAPGTFGSIAALPLLYFLAWTELELIYILFGILVLIITSCVLAEKIQKKFSLHDPQWIVVDEVLGMLVTWAFIAPSLSLNQALLILVLFRFFDIIKFWPASYFDKQSHGSGTILDDIASGIYAGITLLIGKFFLPQYFS